MPLEIACFNVASAIIAANTGANRIELCANGHLGGTTPPLIDLKTLKTSLKQECDIPVNVMIRPRGGNFIYSDEEFETMEKEILAFKELKEKGPDGFVFGILTEEGEVDRERCKRVMFLAGGSPCTFHRAFDEISDQNRGKAVEDILALGFAGVLTSGGASDAVSGKEELEELVRKVEGTGCEIIVGGGVRAANVKGLKEDIRARWFHSSAVLGESGIADEGEVRKMVEILRGNG